MAPSKGSKDPFANAKKNRARPEKPASPSKGGGYAWGDGKGPVHSRPKRSGAQLGKAKQAKLLKDPAYFTQPMTLGEALQEGNRAAGLQYDPQIAQVQLQQREAPVWYQNYRDAIQTPAQTQAQYQPAIQAVQANQQQTAQATPGIDPNSDAGKTDALAAQARAALVGLGAATLQAGAQADTTYNQGRKGVASAAEIGTNTQLATQLGSLQGQRGAAVGQYVSDARNSERQYGLSQQHQNVENKAFNVDTAVKAANIKTDRQKIRATAKQKKRDQRAKSNTPVTSGPFAGMTPKEIRALTPAAKEKLRAESHGGGSKAAKPRFTPEQTSKSNATLRKAVALVQAGRKLPSGGAPEYWGQAYDQLVQDGMDPAVARAAVQLVRHGKVGPRTKRTLQDDYGIRRYPKGSKRKKPPGTSSGGGGGPHGTGRG